ncbi:hypothetical protein O9992_16700 [Vibrio lentus]|nr:hypothetical protein [Vibrio lentus]
MVSSQSTAKTRGFDGLRSFFILGILFGLITMTFGQVSFGLGNAVGLTSSGIMLGLAGRNHPTFGYVPQGGIEHGQRLGFDVLHGRYRLERRW